MSIFGVILLLLVLAFLLMVGTRAYDEHKAENAFKEEHKRKYGHLKK